MSYKSYKSARQYYNALIKTLIRSILLLVILWAAASFLSACSGGGQDTAPRQNQPPEDKRKETPQEKPEEEFIKTGMYKIGTDLEAGEYILYSEGGLAYFAVTKDSSGELESIIFNDNFSGTRYVTVEDGQYLEFTGSKMLPVENAPPQEPKDGKYDEGMYKVGRDISAGEYKVIPHEGELAYYEIRKDSKGSIEGIVANDNFESEKYITIKDGQYVKLSGCYIDANRT